MSVLRESKIEAEVVKWAKSKGIKVCKVQFVETGHPDRLFILPNGLHVWIEFKRPGETPSRLQYYRIRELQSYGVVATWTDDENDGIDILAAQIVPEESDRYALGASLWRLVPRSRIRENQYRARYISDFEESESGQENADSRALEARVQGLAGRDQKVDGVQGADLRYSSWDRQRKEFKE